MHLSIHLSFTLAVLQAAKSKPSAQLGSRASTDQQHTLHPPLSSLYNDSQLWMVFRKLLHPSLH